MSTQEKSQTQDEQSIEQEVRSLCLEILGRNPEMNEELLLQGQDPQNLNYLFRKLQKKFQIEITNEETRELKTLNKVLDCVVLKTMGID
jgi:acyl carrier protein